MADVRLPLLAALLLAGCLGDVPTGGNTGGVGGDAGSGDPASAAWTSTIAPIVTSTTHNCTEVTACHGGAQPPKLTSWLEFKASGVPAGRYTTKTNNLVVGKAALLNNMPHPLGNLAAKPYLDATELMTFQTFITTYGM